MNKEFSTSSMDFISTIRKAYPVGATYTRGVMQLAFELSLVAKSFSKDSLLGNYGPYPFLEVEEVHYEENNTCSEQVILCSRFDFDSFKDWVDSLSIYQGDKNDIIMDVTDSYRKQEGALDTRYLDVIKYVTEYLKCLRSRKESDISCITSILSDIHIGRYKAISLTQRITVSQLRNIVRNYNSKHGKASGKFVRLHDSPGIPHAFILSCEKHSLNIGRVSNNKVRSTSLSK